MNYTIREIKTSEYPLLDDFLYEAIYIPKGAVPPPRSIDLVQQFPVNPLGVLAKVFILDVILDDFPINRYGAL